MAWEIEVTDQFWSWWADLTTDQQAAVASAWSARRAWALAGPPRLLLGGDKSGQWNEWYERAVPFADELYDVYLDELREEGLI